VPAKQTKVDLKGLRPGISRGDVDGDSGSMGEASSLGRRGPWRRYDRRERAPCVPDMQETFDADLCWLDYAADWCRFQFGRGAWGVDRLLDTSLTREGIGGAGCIYIISAMGAKPSRREPIVSCLARIFSRLVDCERYARTPETPSASLSVRTLERMRRGQGGR
jgi:hypothetical protein